MTNLDEIFKALSKSAFRNKFRLQGKDIIYLRSKGLPTVIVHAREFIAKRLAPAVIQNDGKKNPLPGSSCFSRTTCNSMLLPQLSGKMA